MVKDLDSFGDIFGIDPIGGDPLQALALSYAPTAVRSAFAALFALDATLAQVVATTTQPIVGQMRLAWWREAIEALDTGSPPAQPILRALAGSGTPIERIAAMVEPWEALLLGERPAIDAMRDRGKAVFGAAAALLRASGNDPVGQAGAGWALRDRTLLDEALRARWSPRGRALGAVALAVRLNLRDAGPSAVLRMLAFRISGR